VNSNAIAAIRMHAAIRGCWLTVNVDNPAGRLYRSLGFGWLADGPGTPPHAEIDP
jgi:ribosomal protein S18 acetylase RimI-like enzyme